MRRPGVVAAGPRQRQLSAGTASNMRKLPAACCRSWKTLHNPAMAERMPARHNSTGRAPATSASAYWPSSAGSVVVRKVKACSTNGLAVVTACGGTAAAGSRRQRAGRRAAAQARMRTAGGWLPRIASRASHLCTPALACPAQGRLLAKLNHRGAAPTCSVVCTSGLAAEGSTPVALSTFSASFRPVCGAAFVQVQQQRWRTRAG